MCCQGVHTAGIQNLVSYVQACDCNGGACTTVCASEYCAHGNYASTGDPCQQCIADSIVTADGGMGACYNQVAGSCSNNVDCAAYLTCVNGCPNTP
jgi:hypothetical protein